MAGKLTDAKLKALKAPVEGQAEYSDPEVPGLRVRIGTTGTKTFILRKRVAGRIRNISLGRYGPRFGLADAHRKARAILSDLEAGKAPNVAPKRSSKAETVGGLMPAYLASKASLRSLVNVQRIVNRYILPALGDRLADAVTRANVTALIDEIGATKPEMARAVYAQLSAFFTWAMPRLERLAANPCRDAGRPPKAKARDRVLTDAELIGLWHVADAEPLPWGPALKLLILTGARRNEVFEADRAEFDAKAAEWTVPPARAKNGHTHIVPLSDAAIALLKAVPEVDGSAKLFPASGNIENGPSGYSRAQSRFRASLNKQLDRDGCKHWTLHDIRRTVATGLQRLGVRFEVTEAVLNHVSGAKGGIAGVYQRHDWKAEKRTALGAWAHHVAELIAGSDNSEGIVPG